ncbi:hypothetical protein [Streptomyces sp. ST2-7A]|uniref:hypothetical protein n=1 Tax=Streptomyces sp. ST2-7A TaxID=2907214 RepID=UPI001F359B4F|nr:hypothetical protein [Streptomyces sp. ST2-7A]MCE7082827.1 hypothetical protein [Streptomyces sp. ST2-7A]
MRAPGCAWRAEIVAYQGDPVPQMFHLGEAFALDPDVLREAVRTRVVEIADHLAEGDVEERRVANVFRRWADSLAGEGPHSSSQPGGFSIHSFTGGGCVWELSLRPVGDWSMGVDR